ncbi:MAG: hypothetical protein EKK57_07240 [Proteobacteria bacterium]|nr:MAG: hypothetical protein EKK57_07240 [Pseudomonadota bacterium]
MNINAARAAVEFMSKENGFNLKEREYAVAIFDGAKGMVAELLNIGHVDYVYFGEPNEVAKKARAAQAKKVYFIHNHPNGNNQPSIADIKLTNWFRICLQNLGLELMDHFIIAEKIVSMKDTGLMNVDYLN